MFFQAIESLGGSIIGNIGKACDIVKIHRQTYYLWLQEDPSFAKVVNDYEEKAVDDMEKVLQGIAKNTYNTPAAIAFLKAKGRHRGWQDQKQEIEITGSQEIKIEVIPPTVYLPKKDEDTV